MAWGGGLMEPVYVIEVSGETQVILAGTLQGKNQSYTEGSASSNVLNTATESDAVRFVKNAIL